MQLIQNALHGGLQTLAEPRLNPHLSPLNSETTDIAPVWHLET